jgi:AMMECR1 domain-containing protein
MRQTRIGGALGIALLPTLGSAQVYNESRLIQIARQAVVSEVTGKSSSLPPEGTLPRPVFVTIEVAGQVRGCRGELTIRGRSLESEVALAARAAAAHDPRYRPLSPLETKRFLVTVTIVERQETIESVNGLRAEDGLILKSGGRTGIVLPWEGRDPAIRLDWAYRKAGVPRERSVVLSRLVAQRFRG